METTPLVICIVTVLVLAWDVYLYTDKKEGNSITQVIIASSKRWPIIAFALGFLMGHFYG